MREIVMVKYGEIALKGINKKTFEDMLQSNIKRRLKKIGLFSYERMQSTIYIEPQDGADVDEAVRALQKIFGIGAIQKCAVFPKDIEAVRERLGDYLKEALDGAKTFKIEAKRADKTFPLTSPEIQQTLGDAVLDAFPNIGVDVHRPDVTVRLEIRDNGAYLSAKRITGAGGMPVGSSGKALLMLSGGIDSPAAGYMMAKRGLVVDCIHYISPPYTSERALTKVRKLCEEMTEYCGDIMFYCVPFTEIQEAIKDNCPEEFFTIIMRRLMMEIAQRIAENDNCLALITGESVGQVASQTMAAIACTDAVCRIPVFRPLVGMDKTEIIEIARKIDTFETSTLPYEDCCTVFTPRHPKVRPRLEDIERAQGSFDFEPLIQKAVEGTEMKTFNFE